MDWYLQVDEADQKHDIIVKTDVIDLAGYELRKALQLMRRSNPPILEWFQSDIIYHEHKQLMQQVRNVASLDPCFSRANIINHFHSIARQNWIDYLKDKPYVNRKKYLYVLRCLFQAEFMRVHEQWQEMPPLHWEKLIAGTTIVILSYLQHRH